MCQEPIRIQFILKRRETGYDNEPCYGNVLSSGLFNSAHFVVERLNESRKVITDLVHVIDNNCIDKEVTRFSPDVVIIEAYWVVPEKFEVLTRLHPKVKWIIRNHSEMPFAAQEGIIMDWSLRYLLYPNVYVSCNSSRSANDMGILLEAAYPHKGKKVVYLPNMYYSKHQKVSPSKPENECLDIACFGAIRPLKNHLIQAVAAIEFAKLKHKKLRFHINGNRIEGGQVSNNILKNLRLLFAKLPDCELVEHPWYSHEDFLEVLKTMDLGLQVSFSETFNIISADMVHVGLPIVTSKECLWAPHIVFTDPTDTTKIVNKMKSIWAWRKTTIEQRICQWHLNKYSKKSLNQWLVELHKLTDK